MADPLQPELTIKHFGPKRKVRMVPTDDPEAFHRTGGYSRVSAVDMIRMRGKFEKNTLVTAKLPKPVSVKTVETIREQPAKNISDPWYPTLNDLDFREQQDILGKDPDELFVQENNELIEKLRKTQEVQPYINPPPRLSSMELKQLLERI